MKKQTKLASLVLLLIGIVMPQFIQAQQASTEGKEFWVALTLCAAPSTGTPEPFIAVSTKEATTVTITNPNLPNWPGVSRPIGVNQWEVFDINDISLDKWYPTSANSIANAAQQAGKTNNFGLKVVADKDVSVYAALRMPNSFDAANVLPIHVLQNAAYEYYTQDYPPYIKPDDGEALSMFTVLATEDGTNVTITPTCKTHDGKAANASFTIPLTRGKPIMSFRKLYKPFQALMLKPTNRLQFSKETCSLRFREENLHEIAHTSKLCLLIIGVHSLL